MTSDDETRAEDAIRQWGPRVFDYDSIALRSIRGMAPRARQQATFEVSEETALRILDSVLESCDRTWEARQRCEEAIGVLARDELQLLDASITVAQACLRVLNRRLDLDKSGDTSYVVNMLGSRAQSTCHEISALLRAGFPSGARARWRTLHEVAVTSSVILIGDRHTAARFRNHRWVMLARDRRHTAPAESWPTSPSPEAMSRRLIQRYGATYEGKYGWASRVTSQQLQVAKPQWHHLEKVAGLADGHRDRVMHAHHAVHVDSLSANDLIDSTGRLHAGGRLDGFRPVVWQTVKALTEAVDSLLGVWQKQDGSPLIRATRAYASHVLFEI